MAFFSPEAEMALMVQDESMNHLFPQSSCQSPPGLIYSSPLQPLARGPAISQAGSGHLYDQPNGYRSMPYQQQNFWTSQPTPVPQNQVSYSGYPPFTGITTGQTLAPDPILLPPMGGPRPTRSPSASSLGVPPSERSPPSLSRSLSPSSPDLRAYGFPNKNGTWSCNYPGCTSRAVFTRGCDLRKHHKRHTKSFFCRHEGCPQATGGGFSSKKDLARHEAKHNPGVLCDWDGCDRVFSRVDNMRDHVKRIHLKKSRTKSGSSS